MIIERPVRNTGQSVAPRHSIVPFQRGGGSPATSASRTVEWMPSAPMSASPRTGSARRRRRDRRTCAVTPSSSCSNPARRQLVQITSSPEPLDHRVAQHALQHAAVDRELRHGVAGVQPAQLAPHLLAEAVHVDQLVGAHRRPRRAARAGRGSASSPIACGSVLMPTPSSRMLGDCSNTRHSRPRRCSVSAVVRPPMPPPTTMMGSALAAAYALGSPRVTASSPGARRPSPTPASADR